jgi:hypothetical protein
VLKALLSFDAEGNLETIHVIVQTEEQERAILRGLARMTRPSMWELLRRLFNGPEIRIQNKPSGKDLSTS